MPSSDYEALASAVGNLHDTWAVWNHCFYESSSNEAFEAYRQTAVDVFGFTYNELFAGVVLGLARLSDRLEVCGNENITLERVFEGTDFTGHEGWKRAAQKAMSEALLILRGEDFRQLRDKRLAHHDRAVAIGTEKPPKIEIDLIRKGVRWAVQFCDRINGVEQEPSRPVYDDGPFARECAERDQEILVQAKRLVERLRASAELTQLGSAT